MRSRNQLLGVLVNLHGWHPNEANTLIDDFAHELADSIRKHYGKPRIDGDCAETYASGYNAGTHNAADLIDPQSPRTTTTEETPR